MSFAFFRFEWRHEMLSSSAGFNLKTENWMAEKCVEWLDGISVKSGPVTQKMRFCDLFLKCCVLTEVWQSHRLRFWLAERPKMVNKFSWCGRRRRRGRAGKNRKEALIFQEDKAIYLNWIFNQKTTYVFVITRTSQ